MRALPTILKAALTDVTVFEAKSGFSDLRIMSLYHGGIFPKHIVVEAQDVENLPQPADTIILSILATARD
jgi:hypothetical protein